MVASNTKCEMKTQKKKNKNDVFSIRIVFHKSFLSLAMELNTVIESAILE